MTLRQFINKYDGKTVDWDQKFGGQCVDLWRQYVDEVLELPQSPPVRGAKDVWDTYLEKHFNRVENTPKGVPEKGDIVIWETGEYGHIAIFAEGGIRSFTSFDQNYPVGTKCHLQKHNYQGVLGWLHPITNSDTNMTEEQDRILKFLKENEADEGKVREAFGALADKERLEQELSNLRKQISDLNSSQEDLESRLKKLEAKISQTQEEKEDWQKQAETASKRLAKISKDFEDCDTERKQWKSRYEAKCQETADKLTTWQTFKLFIYKLGHVNTK